ncbi:hypothetical protein HETIRDRAFT_108696 [Heterobasidion irregulare TC 32-1]|uniref:Uncharacterized protein n=1 Tax=Heterobasidion irregulare (strain TC 32-1) TaxID=747525 RepID=W4KBG1_HETIT|nr:uncharacterized protein HETIRDRAFT_108696 [Heterobasidion irregulare TC 32-1]XP_009553017.1 uncharacterized protein HETIRDRAFT_456166 [Heterobasidion irregulare TC 32-1]ETW75621.1 hypothetical protein HETIRDRAFT_456166 [Heterobasidion irregulare TC 32-1]ETW82391.1 hypothetical protein HETIRDRAFT_108696 [Heterobasidion irregulare TC 32-1]
MSLKHYSITSKSSVQKASTGSTTAMMTEDNAAHASFATAANLKSAHLAPMVQHSAQMSTAVGVLMLSIAALAALCGDPVPPFPDLMFLTAAPPALSLPFSDAAIQELAARLAPARGQSQLPCAPPLSSRLSSTDASSLHTIDTHTAFSSSMSTASLHTVILPSSHKRSMTIYKGKSVSTVLITSAIDTVAASCKAKCSAPLRESFHIALEMVCAGMGGNRPREIFEPLRLACETRNEKPVVASLDCISKLIFCSFIEANPPEHASLPSLSSALGACHSTLSAS